jgi:polyhydroxyalkanoate synthesis regulator phasin
VPEGAGPADEKGVAEALRAAIEGTLSQAGKRARAGSAALRGERATQLLDEVARRGRWAGDELTRRGQGARDELARRGQEAREEVTARLETLERRLLRVEAAVRTRPKPKAED